MLVSALKKKGKIFFLFGMGENESSRIIHEMDSSDGELHVGTFIQTKSKIQVSLI